MTASVPLSTPLQDFLQQYHRETGRPGLAERLTALRHGAVTLSSEELSYGARLAWRHSTRCVGRAAWNGLRVRDLRHVTAPDEVWAGLLDHLQLAWNGGRVQALLSVFGPGVRVLNPQLIRYAAYRQPDGRVVGDPQNLELTHRLQQLGWPGGPGTSFDVLPVAIQAQGRVQLYTLPPAAVQEVRIGHPKYPQLAELGLKWHALPVISDLALEVAGQHFSCAPFSGWYLQTEIAARNLADRDRYDVLPQVARLLQLDTSRERTLWRDRALLELNVAVLHSFDAAGVRLADHHGVTRQFVRFEQQEERAGRAVYGRWSWLVPPLSPALTPVWHRQYQDRQLSPAFLAQQSAWPGPAVDEGGRRCPVGH
ncbi:nitric oxide synthase oxygenase [Deinococcus sonorensis]|uniref:Nitric oxide synthase oxygenase n=2 Tax=Deinococcus sonorensis TaxID=309891 RepID=A0AAU7U5U0_9DEIO